MKQSHAPELKIVRDGDYLTELLGEDFTMGPDNHTWVNIERNLMYRLGDDVGLATYDYPGVYTVHWFFKSKGKEALRVARIMLDYLFMKHEPEVLRALVLMENKPSRYMAKYMGFEHLSVEEFSDGPTEVMILTKKVFRDKGTL